MMLARVIGNVVATVKHPAIEGKKLLLLQPITRDGQPRGKPLVALDAVGAGFRETVYWCRGREASLAFPGEVPSDASVVGIVDTITAQQAAAREMPPSTPAGKERPAPPSGKNPRKKNARHSRRRR